MGTASLKSSSGHNFAVHVDLPIARTSVQERPAALRFLCLAASYDTEINVRLTASEDGSWPEPKRQRTRMSARTTSRKVTPSLSPSDLGSRARIRGDRGGADPRGIRP
jgi:hypothetical protein